MATDIKNDLPDGVEFFRIGVPSDDEFEVIKYTEDETMIHKGKRAGLAAGMLVKPKAGYTFQPSRYFDIRAFAFKDGPPNTFMAVKQFDAPLAMKVTASFSVTNEFDRQILADVINKLNALPGYVEHVVE